MRIKTTAAVLALSAPAMVGLAVQQTSEPQMLLEKAKFAMEIRGDVPGAIDIAILNPRLFLLAFRPRLENNEQATGPGSDKDPREACH